MKRWTSDDIPNLTGKTAIITGGNTGLGYEITKQLAAKGAEVIIACRTKTKGLQALSSIQKEISTEIKGHVIPLDLTDLKSIHNFNTNFNRDHKRLDLLINNAGVVNLKSRQTTKTGLEMHMATNHLGHFALTGLLYETIKATPKARVVTMSSGGHKAGQIDFDDINWEKRPYSRTKSYGDSKLANLLFMKRLQDKFQTEQCNALSVGAHPGLSATERQQTIGIGGIITKLLAQPVWKGALPALRAATDPIVEPGSYYGPQYGIAGYPTEASMHASVNDLALAYRLWEYSEEITGIKY